MDGGGDRGDLVRTQGGVDGQRADPIGEALARPDGLTNPEFTRMVVEKGEAAGEAARRLSHQVVRAALSPTLPHVADVTGGTLGAAQAVLSPFHRRVRANVKRLRSKRG